MPTLIAAQQPSIASDPAESSDIAAHRIRFLEWCRKTRGHSPALALAGLKNAL